MKTPVAIHPQALINTAISRTKKRIYDILAQRETVYATRCDYAAHAVSVISVLLRHMSLEHDGAVVTLIPGTNTCRPMRMKQIASEAGVSLATAERIIADLGALGKMDRGRQALRSVNGCLSVTGVLRRLSADFWALLGLGSTFAYACKKAVKRLTLLTPQYLLHHVVRRRVVVKSAPPPNNSAMFARATRCPRFRNDCNHCDGGDMPPEVCAGAAVICAGLQAVGR